MIDTELFQSTPFREAKGLVLEEKWGLFVHVATIARSPSGTLVVACIGGPRAEPEPDNVIAMARSFDNGETWTPLKGMIDPDDGWRAFDPVLWTRPDGKIWIQWAEGDCPGFRKRDRERRAFSGFLTVDGEEIGFSDVQPWIGHETGNWAVNPPIVLSSGRWVVPMQNGPFQYVRSSDDQGRTWVNREQATTEQVPGGIDEATFIQREDGRLWALYRTTGGRLFEGFSDDEGDSWIDIRETGIPNPGTKPFLLKLASGRVLLLNNATFASRVGYKDRPPPADKYSGRSFLTAALSEDDGRTFCAELVLDRDRFVCYPSAIQDPEGVIHIVYRMKTELAYSWVGGPIEDTSTGLEAGTAVARVGYGQLTEEMILACEAPEWGGGEGK